MTWSLNSGPVKIPLMQYLQYGNKEKKLYYAFVDLEKALELT